MTTRREFCAPSKLSLVGLSAAEYGATHDSNWRLRFLPELIKVDYLAAIDLVRKHRWWNDVEQLAERVMFPPEFLKFTAHVLGEHLLNYGAISRQIAKLDPNIIADKVIIFGADPSTAWTLLKNYIERLDLDSKYGLLNVLIRNDVLAGEEASALIQQFAESERLSPTDAASRNDVERLFRHLPEVLRSLAPRRAATLLERVTAPEAITSSSASLDLGDHFSFVHGAGQNLYECANIVADRLSPTAAVAWSSAVLLRAFAQDYKKWGTSFDGRELSGSGHSQIGNVYSYQDNGWLVRVVVPALRRRFAQLTTYELKRRFASPLRVTALHSAFRQRAAILAIPSSRLGELSELLVKSSSIDDGIPSISNAIAVRARESLVLASRFLDWRFQQFGMPTNPDESALLHKLIASGDEHAFDWACKVVRDERFKQFEPHVLGFFPQLDWASKFPDKALKLASEAIASGYRAGLFDLRYIAGIVTDCLAVPQLNSYIFRHSKLRKLVAIAAASRPELYERFAVRAYRYATKEGKTELLRNATSAPLHVALKVIERGLLEKDPTPTSDIERRFLKEDTSVVTGLRSTAYFSLAQILQEHGIRAVDHSSRDIVGLIAAEKGAYAAHFGLYAYSALYNACLKADRDDIIDRIMDGCRRLIDTVSHPIVREQIAGLFASYYPKLEPELRALMRTELAYTHTALSSLVHEAIVKQATKSQEELLRIVASCSPELRRWTAWLLWTRISKETETYRLTNPHLSALLDQLMTHPDKDLYGSLGRALVSGAQLDPGIAVDKVIQLCILALRGGTQMYLSWQDLDLAYASPTDVLQLASSLAEHDLNSIDYTIVAFAADLLQYLTDPQQTSEVKNLFEVLKIHPTFAQAYITWRSKLL